MCKSEVARIQRRKKSNRSIASTTKVQKRESEGEHIVQNSDMDLLDVLSLSAESRLSASDSNTTNSNMNTASSSHQDQMSSIQNCRRVTIFRVKKGSHGLAQLTFSVFCILFVLDHMSSDLISRRVDAAAITNRLPNAWERPCGDTGKVTPQNNKGRNGAKNQIKSVVTQTQMILNMMANKANSNFLPDGDWGHAMPSDFVFPNIDDFSFRKVHSALQQYIAIFEMIKKTNLDDMSSTFDKMQFESKALLCLIENHINGTSAGAAKTKNVPTIKYFQKTVMGRKLKALAEALRDENRTMPIVKQVFAKYTNFVNNVEKTAKARLNKMKRRQKLKKEAQSANGVAHSMRAKEVAQKERPVQSNVGFSQSVVERQTKNPNKRIKKNQQQQQQQKNEIDGSSGPRGSKRRGGKGLKRKRKNPIVV